MNAIRRLVREILLEDLAGFVKRTQEIQYSSDSTDPRCESQMNAIRRLVREILLEDLAGFVKRTQEIQYSSDSADPTFEKHKQTKLQAREVKRIWRAEADHEFMRSLIKIHWIDDKGNRNTFDPVKLLDFLMLPRKNEIATQAWLSDSTIIQSEWGKIGVIVQGTVTLAANDMNEIYSGYFDKLPIGLHQKYRSSGVPRRSTYFNDRNSFVLDRKSFDSTSSEINEFIVDNWRPTGIIIQYPADILIESVRDTVKLGVDAKILGYVDALLSVNKFSGPENTIPIYDETMKQIDMRQLARARKGE